MSDKGTMVIGRVVSMEAGRARIVTPLTRHPAEIRLLAAARRYRDGPNDETHKHLVDAAKAIN